MRKEWALAIRTAATVQYTAFAVNPSLSILPGAGWGRGRLARGKPAPFPSLPHCAPRRWIHLPRDFPRSAIQPYLCVLCVFPLRPLRFLFFPLRALRAYFVVFVFQETERLGCGQRPPCALCDTSLLHCLDFGVRLRKTGVYPRAVSRAEGRRGGRGGKEGRAGGSGRYRFAGPLVDAPGRPLLPSREPGVGRPPARQRNSRVFSGRQGRSGE
jgi:hypothetical protein